MRLLDRYVIRETVAPFLMALAVLTFLFQVRPMMDQAQQLLTRGVPVGTVLYLLATLLPQALGVTLPMALLIGLLIGLGRLSADRETVAFLACGVSLWRLLRPALIVSGLVALFTLWVMIDGIPAGNKAFVRVTTQLIAERSAQEIKPGQFYEGFPGKVLRVESVTPDGEWQRVMLAITRENTPPTLVLADTGRLILDPVSRRAEIVLQNASRFMPGTGGTYDRGDRADERYALNPDEMFPRQTVVAGVPEMTIAELREEWDRKIARGEDPRNAIMYIHQKFSFPVACLVMGLLAVALGVHTRKDGKFAAFALGLAVIMVYYSLLQMAQNLTRGEMFPAAWSRWVPNIVLGAAGLALLAWRARDSERSVALRLPPRVSAWLARLTTGPEAPEAPAAAPGRPVVVVRIPVLNIPRPRLLDIYLLRRYFTVVILAFTGLLGLFYIGTVIDLSEKVFKGNASSAMLLDYLFYGTPKFIYLLMPLAVLIAALVTIGTFSRTGELTVMRSCGVSLYRLTVPLVLVAGVWSLALFAMEERVMAEANRRQQVLDDQIRQRPSVILDVFDRHWVAGTNGRIYFYRLYDQRQRQFADLSVYQISADPYRVVQHTFVASASATRRGWAGGPGWSQAFPADKPGPLRPFERRTLALDDARLFETEDRDAQAMTVSQLGRYVKTLKEGGLNSGSFQVELHRKLAMPLMTIVMTLLAVPFGVTTGRRGALYGIGLAIALSFAYQAAFVAFGFFGAAELLPAVLAAWAPNLLFLAGASYLLLTART